MIQVKIKTKDHKGWFIPVPYAMLSLFSALLTSKWMIGFVNNQIEKKSKKPIKVPQIEREELKPLLKELSAFKGLVLVETKLKDGMEVSVRL